MRTHFSHHQQLETHENSSVLYMENFRHVEIAFDGVISCSNTISLPFKFSLLTELEKYEHKL